MISATKRLTDVRVENFLSLRDVSLRLQPLNVLVGPNGAGKTNLLKVFQFLGEVARQELAPAVLAIGGYDNLFFRGRNPSGTTIKISLKGIVTKHASENALDEYKLSFWRQKRSFRFPRFSTQQSNVRVSEFLYRNENIIFKRTQGRGRRITLSGGKVTVADTSPGDRGTAQSTQIDSEATGLGTLRRFGESYGSGEWSSFAELVEGLRLFEIDVDKIRKPGAAEADRLRPDGSNLSAFLHRLSEEEPHVFARIRDDVHYVLPSFEDFAFTNIGGSDYAVRLDLKEKHLSKLTPLGRASYGTIRAIALFAMLNDPSPPALTCLEEIDHGLHPHALDRIVERLREASKITQIIVATHSPALVNRLKPSELIIAERVEDTGASRLFRPDQNMIARLRTETGYELGELWFSGLIGGGL